VSLETVIVELSKELSTWVLLLLPVPVITSYCRSDDWLSGRLDDEDGCWSSVDHDAVFQFVTEFGCFLPVVSQSGLWSGSLYFGT